LAMRAQKKPQALCTCGSAFGGQSEDAHSRSYSFYHAICPGQGERSSQAAARERSLVVRYNRPDFQVSLIGRTPSALPAGEKNLRPKLKRLSLAPGSPWATGRSAKNYLPNFLPAGSSAGETTVVQ